MRLGNIRNFGRVCLLLAVTLTAALAYGQNANTGEIKGTVQDSSGAVVDAAKVTITNAETGVSIVTATNSAGIYDAPSVPSTSPAATAPRTTGRRRCAERCMGRVKPTDALIAKRLVRGSWSKA